VDTLANFYAYYVGMVMKRCKMSSELKSTVIFSGLAAIYPANPIIIHQLRHGIYSLNEPTCLLGVNNERG